MLAGLLGGIDVLADEGAATGVDLDPNQRKASNALPVIIADAIARAEKLADDLDRLETAQRAGK